MQSKSGLSGFFAGNFKRMIALSAINGLVVINL